MEQNLPIITKKIWSLMRVIFFMLKKGISKTKLLSDLNTMMKRGKIAGKALHNLLFHHHHHHHWAAATTTTIHRHPHHLSFPSPYSTDSEFSCTTTPQHHHLAAQNPPQAAVDDVIDEVINDTAVMKALSSATSPPGVAGFGNGRSLFVKELRITDSPFPVSDGDGDGQVDEAAEMFIMRFYNDLRRQN